MNPDMKKAMIGLFIWVIIGIIFFYCFIFMLEVMIQMSKGMGAIFGDFEEMVEESIKGGLIEV